jgi:hypothetical protein
MSQTQRSSRTKRAAPGRDEPERRRRRVRSRTEQPKERPADRDEQGFLFDDPYWDDAFGSYYDPTLGTCCRI